MDAGVGAGAELTTAQLPGLVKEWMSLKDEMQTLAAALKEKRKRAKLVTSLIQRVMKSNQLGQLRTSAGAVLTRPRKVKAPLTKKFIVATLTEFFKGDAETAKKCAEFLDTHRPLKMNETLTLEAPE